MIGDKVICIDNKNVNNSVSLTIGKSYTIREFDVYDYNIDVINDDGDIGQYRMQRFTTLETWREQQLNKLFITSEKENHITLLILIVMNGL